MYKMSIYESCEQEKSRDSKHRKVRGGFDVTENVTNRSVRTSQNLLARSRLSSFSRKRGSHGGAL